MSIPMYVTHPKPQSPKPMIQSPTSAPPTQEYLQTLLDGKMDAIVEQLLEMHKLPFRIEDGKIIDALEGTDLWLSRFITCDPSCIELKELARKCAKSDLPVLITGQTGTGKELIAKSMIGNRTGKFVAINCAGMPENLIESELFGYVKGAFTGAEGNKQGLFAFAKDGVMFLDEIGELPIHLQAKFLRAIQDKQIRRVGGQELEPINCKFVCATNRDLRVMQDKGLFREDLYARLSTLELRIPSLSERPDDIKLFLESTKSGRAFFQAFLEGNYRIQDMNLRYNIRSLERMIGRFEVFGKIMLD